MTLVAAAGLGASAWVVGRVVDAPEVRATPGTDADAARAEQKIYDAVRGSRGRSRGAEPVALSEAELNAFVTRHLLETIDTPLESVNLRLLGDGAVEFQARMPLRRLTLDPPLSYLTGVLPAEWLAHRVSVGMKGRVRVESGDSRSARRVVRIAPEHFWLGRQRLPTLLARLLIDPAALRLLRWRLPRAVESVTIEPGRAIIHPYPTSSR
jgi:hypothetical protein